MSHDARHIPISDYDYPLPQDRIATHPLADRSASRLLIYREGAITDDRFHELPHYLPPGTALVLNNTRVLQARLFFQKPTGGQIEIFLLEPYDQSIEDALAAAGGAAWQCLIGGASKWKPGQVLRKTVTAAGREAVLTATYIKKLEDSFVVELNWDPADTPFSDIVQSAGAMPLPPYIKREATAEDAARYQTVFGRHEGSVAAPTAALHFTPELLNTLRNGGCTTEFVTLHVGAGTFKPVKAATLEGHHMHQEPFSVRRETIRHLLAAPRVVAVGTTSLRTLESLHWLGVKLDNGLIDDDWSLGQWEAYELDEKFPGTTAVQSLGALLRWMEDNEAESLSCRTSLLIAPGYSFRIPSGLITNFHQPQSTLLLLISAFIGPQWRKVYEHALANDYRFLSYGDSSLLWRDGEREENP